LFKPASHTVLQTSLSLAEASRSESCMLHFCKVNLMSFEKCFLVRPADLCPCKSSP